MSAEGRNVDNVYLSMLSEILQVMGTLQTEVTKIKNDVALQSDMINSQSQRQATLEKDLLALSANDDNPNTHNSSKPQISEKSCSSLLNHIENIASIVSQPIDNTETPYASADEMVSMRNELSTIKKAMETFRVDRSTLKTVKHEIRQIQITQASTMPQVMQIQRTVDELNRTIRPIVLRNDAAMNSFIASSNQRIDQIEAKTQQTIKDVQNTISDFSTKIDHRISAVVASTSTFDARLTRTEAVVARHTYEIDSLRKIVRRHDLEIRRIRGYEPTPRLLSKNSPPDPKIDRMSRQNVPNNSKMTKKELPAERKSPIFHSSTPQKKIYILTPTRDKPLGIPPALKVKRDPEKQS